MAAHQPLLDGASVFTVALTLALFVVALFVKGFTHDLLLEAGVFLVSVKLVLMNYKNSVAMRTLEHHLDEIKSLIESRRT